MYPNIPIATNYTVVVDKKLLLPHQRIIVKNLICGLIIDKYAIGLAYCGIIVK